MKLKHIQVLLDQIIIVFFAKNLLACALALKFFSSFDRRLLRYVAGLIGMCYFIHSSLTLIIIIIIIIIITIIIIIIIAIIIII